MWGPVWAAAESGNVAYALPAQGTPISMADANSAAAKMGADMGLRRGAEDGSAWPVSAELDIPGMSGEHTGR